MVKPDRVKERPVIDLITLAEVAERLRVHVNTARVWGDKGIIPGMVRIGPRRDRHFRGSVVEAWINYNVDRQKIGQ
jgi:predicted site-specific integrase-resolvase